MNTKEITENNIRACGYNVGKPIRGKGTEILTRPSYIYSSWSLQDIQEENREEKINKIIKQIEKAGVENVFVKEIRIIKPDGTKSFNYKGMHEASLKKFNIKKILKSKFKNIDYISIYSVPEVVCTLPLSKFKSDFESQQDMVRMLIWKAEKKNINGDFTDSSYDEIDNQITFSYAHNRSNNAWEDNGDYTLFHGPSICLDDKVVERIDGKLSHYNESVVSDFWDLTMVDEDPFSWVDPDGKVSIYARKGKDWYVTSGIEQEQVFLTYREDDGDLIEEEEFWYFADTADDDLVEKVADIVRGMVVEVEIEGLISNELKTGTWSYQETYEHNQDLFNLKILDREYNGDIDDVRFGIFDLIDWSGYGGVEYKVTQAYEKYLVRNMDDDNKLFGKYSHLNKLKKIVENEGKELVYTEVDEHSDNKQWAIKYKGEEYHFLLSLLFEKSPRGLYDYVSEQLTKRTTERIEMAKVLKQAKYVFVGIEDSIEGGNCMSGTKSFCSRFGINTNIVGGIRGDKLLSLDYSPFTRRAVAQAARRYKIS